MGGWRMEDGGWIIGDTTRNTSKSWQTEKVTTTLLFFFFFHDNYSDSILSGSIISAITTMIRTIAITSTAVTAEPTGDIQRTLLFLLSFLTTEHKGLILFFPSLLCFSFTLSITSHFLQYSVLLILS